MIQLCSKFRCARVSFIDNRPDRISCTMPFPVQFPQTQHAYSSTKRTTQRHIAVVKQLETVEGAPPRDVEITLSHSLSSRENVISTSPSSFSQAVVARRGPCTAGEGSSKQGREKAEGARLWRAGGRFFFFFSPDYCRA